jgi:hypothetical protein
MNGLENMDLSAFFEAPDEKAARLAALRQQQAEGNILAGSSVGGGSVASMGRQMMSNAKPQDSQFDQAMRMMTMQSTLANQQYQRQAAEEAKEYNRLVAADKKQEQLESDIYADAQRYEKGMEELRPLYDSMNRISAAISPYTEGVSGEDIDIPGYGQLEGRAYNWMVGEEGRNVRTAVAGLRDAIFKARAGSAVSEAEADRLLEGLALAEGFTDLDMVKQLQVVANDLNSIIQSKSNVYRPEAVQRYWGGEYKPIKNFYTPDQQEEVIDLPPGK